MKIALCFIISYDHILNKEEIWKEWIEFNKDIINVYFYYKDYKKIKSQWIREHAIPLKYIHETNYYHVIPAYLSVMSFAVSHDITNNWFFMLTDSCCPIISPKRFRYMFYNNHNKSIMSWKPAWWNPSFCKRANLHLLPKELHLGNDPWFVLKREHVLQILCFVNKQKDIIHKISSGAIANESLFAIILYCYRQLDIDGPVISASTHIADWSRMKNATSPHVFKEANEKDIKFIDSELNKNKYSMFIRKVAPEFPNDILKKYIYDKTREDDDKLVLNEPIIFIYNKFKRCVYYFAPYMVIAFISYMMYLYLEIDYVKFI
jgi:hypothetical protein